MRAYPKFREALGFAAEFHAEEHHAGSQIPYISHLLSVASIALEHGADDDEAAAALLHDAIEAEVDREGNVPALKAMLTECFGERVLAIVRACSDGETFPKLPWRERKERFLASLAQADESVLLVSLADKLQNAQTALYDWKNQGKGIWKHYGGKREGTLWYYRALVKAYTARLENLQASANRIQALGWMLRELDRVVGKLEKHTDKTDKKDALSAS